MGRAAPLAAIALALGLPAAAADPAWPPPPQTQARMDALRHTIADPKASAAERQSAREELVRLLMNPSHAGEPLGPMAPRAAPDPAAPAKPFAPAVTPKPAPAAIAPAARPAPAVADPKGGTIVPSGQTAIDPKTGATLVDVGNGWLDPATGRFVPKPR
jgi:hypothetical protein